MSLFRSAINQPAPISDEAARVMGRQAGTIRGLTFRAIEALRRNLGSERAPE